MEYITKIRKKNAKGEYDVIYPSTLLSALIIDDKGLKRLAKAIAKEIAKSEGGAE